MMDLPRETADDRALRHRRRMAFDSIAALYDAARPTYAAEVVDRMVEIAGVARVDASVLEVGCGTGQLTRDLVRYGFKLVAIDPGPSTLAVARRHLAAGDVSLEATTFEALDAPPASFDLIVAAGSSHWIDPEVFWKKSATLLRPGGDGWLAVMDSDTRWDEPVQSALRKLWLDHSENGTAWATEPRPTMEERFEATGLFARALSASVTERRTHSSDELVRLLQTTASFLTYTEPNKVSFLRDLDGLLHGYQTIGAGHETLLTMAPTIGPRGE
jgi:SAM-dependent methyltransferase